jgi:hypothetical protein
MTTEITISPYQVYITSVQALIDALPVAIESGEDRRGKLVQILEDVQGRNPAEQRTNVMSSFHHCIAPSDVSRPVWDAYRAACNAWQEWVDAGALTS